MKRAIILIALILAGIAAVSTRFSPVAAQEFRYPKGMPKKWGAIRSCFATGGNVACVVEDNLGFVRVVKIDAATGNTEKITEFWRE